MFEAGFLLLRSFEVALVTTGFSLDFSQFTSPFAQVFRRDYMSRLPASQMTRQRFLDFKTTFDETKSFQLHRKKGPLDYANSETSVAFVVNLSKYSASRYPTEVTGLRNRCKNCL